MHLKIIYPEEEPIYVVFAYVEQIVTRFEYSLIGKTKNVINVTDWEASKEQVKQQFYYVGNTR